MHRTIAVTVPPSQTARLLDELSRLEPVIGLSVQRGASLKPPGDLLVVHALTRGADEVLRRIQTVPREEGLVSVATAELVSLSDPAHQAAIDRDVDEATWEEMEGGLRHQGRLTANFLVLMALGGAAAGAGYLSDPVPQATAFVAASIVAPGFEPFAKLPLGLVLRRWVALIDGLKAAALGYGVLFAAAALTFWVLRASGVATADELVANPATRGMLEPPLADLLVSACGALAGVAMIASHRREVIAGPVIALELIPAAALVGLGVGAGEPSLLLGGLARLGLDVVLIAALGVPFLLVKQWTTHRRMPIR